MAFHYPKPREHVEPEALTSGSLSAREGYVSQGEQGLSIAISLKRIADLLETIANTGPAPQPRSERE